MARILSVVLYVACSAICLAVVVGWCVGMARAGW